ncbi:MAG: hypothetical protein U0269_13130 [Polyangiales bacterium]
MVGPSWGRFGRAALDLRCTAGACIACAALIASASEAHAQATDPTPRNGTASSAVARDPASRVESEPDAERPQLQFLPNSDAISLEAIDESEVAPAQRAAPAWGLWRRLCVGPCSTRIEPWWSLRLRDGSRTVHDPFRLQPGARMLFVDVPSALSTGLAAAALIVGAAGAVTGGLLFLGAPGRVEFSVIALSGLLVGSLGAVGLGLSAPSVRDERDFSVQPSEVTTRTPLVADAPDIVRPGRRRESGVVRIESNDPHIRVQREIASGTTQDLSTGIVATTTTVTRFETVCEGPCAIPLPSQSRIRIVGPGITSSPFFTVQETSSRLRVRVGRPWQIVVSVVSAAAAIGLLAGGAGFWMNHQSETIAGVSMLTGGAVFTGLAIGFGVASQTTIAAED